MDLLWLIPNPATLDKLTLLGWHPLPGSPVQIYVRFVALVLNLLVAVLVTPALRAGHIHEGADTTRPDDYHTDEGPSPLRPVTTTATAKT